MDHASQTEFGGGIGDFAVGIIIHSGKGSHKENFGILGESEVGEESLGQADGSQLIDRKNPRDIFVYPWSIHGSNL
jgi:hypothetical protein